MTSARSRTFAALAAAALFVGVGSAYAQSILQFDRWMQRIDRRSQSVQRHISAQDAAAAVVDARELGELYGLMEDYFTRRGDSADAVRISREGASLAADVVKAIEDNDFPTASRSAISIAQACRDCHFQYKPLDP